MTIKHANTIHSFSRSYFGVVNIKGALFVYFCLMRIWFNLFSIKMLTWNEKKTSRWDVYTPGIQGKNISYFDTFDLLFFFIFMLFSLKRNRQLDSFYNLFLVPFAKSTRKIYFWKYIWKGRHWSICRSCFWI